MYEYSNFIKQIRNFVGSQKTSKPKRDWNISLISPKYLFACNIKLAILLELYIYYIYWLKSVAWLRWFGHSRTRTSPSTPIWRHNTFSPAEESPRALRRNLSDPLGSISSGSCRFGDWKFLRPLGRPLGLLGGCTVVCTVVENGISLEVGVGPGTMPGSSSSSTPCLGLNCSTCLFQVGPFGRAGIKKWRGPKTWTTTSRDPSRNAILTRTDAFYITGLPAKSGRNPLRVNPLLFSQWYLK